MEDYPSMDAENKPRKRRRAIYINGFAVRHVMMLIIMAEIIYILAIVLGHLMKIWAGGF